MSELTKRWRRRFNGAAQMFAKRFATRVMKHSDVGLADAFKAQGLAVKFTMTDVMKSAIDAVVEENIGLIKSIPQQHFESINVILMESAGRGRDLGWMAEQLQNRFGVTKKRAALIARDQNNKVTSTMQSARQRSLGITEGIWRHSGAGKKKRPSHVKAGRDRLRFKLDKGAHLDGKWVLPGEEINCKCSWSAVIPGFTKLVRNE